LISMSILVDEILVTSGVVVVSEFERGAGSREVSGCARLAGAVEFVRVLWLKTAQAVIVGHEKTHAMKSRWGTAIGWWA